MSKMTSRRFDLSHVNTSESYYGKIIYIKDTLCIPVINLGLMQEHVLNDLDRQIFADKSYLLFKSVEYIAFNEQINHPSLLSEKNLTFYFGGQDLFGSDIYEIKVCCKSGELIILDNAKIESHLWLPIPTPLFRQNMNSMDAIKFINNEDSFDLTNLITN